MKTDADSAMVTFVYILILKFEYWNYEGGLNTILTRIDFY